MWYFIWILGTLLACSFAIISALAIEIIEVDTAIDIFNKIEDIVVDSNSE